MQNRFGDRGSGQFHVCIMTCGRLLLPVAQTWGLLKHCVSTWPLLKATDLKDYRFEVSLSCTWVWKGHVVDITQESSRSVVLPMH